MKPKGIDRQKAEQATGMIFNAKSKTIDFLKNVSSLGRPKPEYTNLDTLLKIKSVADSGYVIILSDDSRWKRGKKDSSLNEYTTGEIVKVLASNKQGPVTYTIELQNKDRGTAQWYFDGFVKG